MHEKKLALPCLARAEHQALKVGSFISKKLQIFDYQLDKNTLKHTPEQKSLMGNDFLGLKAESFRLS